MSEQAVWPEEITPALREVLSLMVFKTAPVAELFRKAGHDIPRRAEAEQAFVLFWAIGLALKHGDNWGKASVAALDAIIRRQAP